MRGPNRDGGVGGRQAVFCAAGPRCFLLRQLKTNSTVCSQSTHRGVCAHADIRVGHRESLCLQQSRERARLKERSKLHPTGRYPTAHPFLWKLWKFLETYNSYSEDLSVVLEHGTDTPQQREPPGSSTPSDRTAAHKSPLPTTKNSPDCWHHRGREETCRCNRCQNVVHNRVRSERAKPSQETTEVNSFTKH